MQLHVAGQSYKVVTTAADDELGRLAAVVESKVSEVTPRGRPVQPQAVLLAALALAHDLEEERSRRESLERRTRDLLRRFLMRIDSALDTSDGL